MLYFGVDRVRGRMVGNGRMIAVYFLILGVYCSIGSWHSIHEGWSLWDYLGCIVWFVLAFGLYREFLIAYYATVVICSALAIAGFVWWAVDPSENLAFLLVALLMSAPVVLVIRGRGRRRTK